MSATPGRPRRRSWGPFARRPDNPDLPGPIAKVTTLVTVLIGLSMIAPVYVLIGSAQRLVTGQEVFPIALLAGTVGVVVNTLLLALVNRVRRGRRWAWITLLFILTLYATVLAAAGLYDLSQIGSAVLLFVAAIPIVMILMLAAPRRSRAYFRRDAATGRTNLDLPPARPRSPRRQLSQ